MTKEYKPCENCADTGWYGDNGPGIEGNKEFQRCECTQVPDVEAIQVLEAAFEVTQAELQAWKDIAEDRLEVLKRVYDINDTILYPRTLDIPAFKTLINVQKDILSKAIKQAQPKP